MSVQPCSVCRCLIALCDQSTAVIAAQMDWFGNDVGWGEVLGISQCGEQSEKAPNRDGFAGDAACGLLLFERV